MSEKQERIPGEFFPDESEVIGGVRKRKSGVPTFMLPPEERWGRFLESIPQWRSKNEVEQTTL